MSLGAIIQRDQRPVGGLDTVPPRQGQFEEMIGKVRVFGQERAVQVRAEDVVRHRSFGAVAGVVAVAGQHRAERPGGWAEKGAATVILEADDG